MECICNKTVLTKERVRFFGRKIRRYMLAYLGIELAQSRHDEGTLFNLDSTTSLSLCLPEMSSSLVEKVVRVFKAPKKCHRNIRDHETKLLKTVVDW